MANDKKRTQLSDKDKYHFYDGMPIDGVVVSFNWGSRIEMKVGDAVEGVKILDMYMIRQTDCWTVLILFNDGEESLIPLTSLDLVMVTGVKKSTAPETPRAEDTQNPKP